MNTAEVASHLGTNPRTLRAFLRSPSSTFRAVGSGARYDFTEAELPTLKKKFAEWKGSGKPKSPAVKVKAPKPRKSTEERQWSQDERVWVEEGPVELEDIRIPRVRARVRAEAKAAEEKLMMDLLAKGLHITQLGDRP